MAYSVPSASSVVFSIVRRPARPVMLPVATALIFQLGGPLQPPEAPRLRTRAWGQWRPADEQDAHQAQRLALLGQQDAISADLTAAAHAIGTEALMAWGSSRHVDYTAQEVLALAQQVAAAIRYAAWSVIQQRDRQQLAAWSSAKPVPTNPAIAATQLLRELGMPAAERLWHVNLRDRPFDPAYDSVPPLVRLPNPTALTFGLQDGYHPPAADHIAFSVSHYRAPYTYPRNSQPSTAGMGVFAEQDNLQRGRWGAGKWYTHGGQPGWGDNSGGEIGNMDPPVEPMEAPYHVMNSIQCFALVGTEKIPVEVDGLSIKYLIEGHAWEVTGTLYGRTAANYLRHTVDGPAHLEVTINGWTWLTAVKRYTRSNKFPSESYQFTALSRSGLLDGDWADKRTITLKSSTPAWQLVDQLLQPLGFSIERASVAEWVQTPDWTLQAGSVSWTGATPMDIVMAVAKAAGAIVVADREHDVLHVYPRYRISPWRWHSAPASAWSHIIPDAMIVDETGEPQATTQLERVLVAGTTHGVITDVVLSGSAGAISAEDVTDPLAQDVAANAERGRNIIGESGAIELLTIKLPLLSPGTSPALLVPGDLIKIQRTGGTDDMGLVLGTTIAPDGMSAVWQTVSVEVHHGNS